MIPAEAVAVLAPAATAGLLAGGRATHVRIQRSRRAKADAVVRPILFAALDEGTFDPRALDALPPIQQRALEAQARSLVTKLRGSDQEILGRLLDRRGALDEARKQSRSRRAATRARAVDFLGNSSSPAAVRDLLARLRDADPQVRWAAARGLGRLGHPSAISPLLASLEGPCSLPVDVVADAVVQIHSCPVSVLRQGLHSRSVPTRAVAVELLGRFQALAAGDEVVELLRADPSVEVRARAARALGRMGSPKPVEALMGCLDAGPMAMRVQAVWALGEIGAPAAVPALRGLLVGASQALVEPAAVALAAMGQLGLTVLERVSEGDGRAAEAAATALATRPEFEPSRG